jgi:hypothetical protein
MAEPTPQDTPINDAEAQQQEDQSDKQKERHLIHPGSQLLIRLPTGEIRHIRIDEKLGERSVNLGKFGSFRVKELVGHPFGLTYEIQKDKSLVILPPQRLEELGKFLFFSLATLKLFSIVILHCATLIASTDYLQQM